MPKRGRRTEHQSDLNGNLTHILRIWRYAGVNGTFYTRVLGRRLVDQRLALSESEYSGPEHTFLCWDQGDCRAILEVKDADLNVKQVSLDYLRGFWAAKVALADAQDEQGGGIVP